MESMMFTYGDLREAYIRGASDCYGLNYVGISKKFSKYFEENYTTDEWRSPPKDLKID